MAILYGTQSNGETLPVEVNQFGQLVAKGIEGDSGPPGPPGIGQLPPDPFEGAILGWEDGELAWIGGSVILPAGTYGPYTYISGNGILDISQNASELINGQQLFMSDDKGNAISAEFATDQIASVRYIYNQLVDDWASMTSGAPFRNEDFNAIYAFDGVINTGNQFAFAASNGSMIFTPTVPFTDAKEVTIRFYQKSNPSQAALKINSRAPVLVGDSISGTYTTDVSGEGLSGIQWSNYDRGEAVGIYMIEVDGKPLVNTQYASPTVLGVELTFATTDNFDKFYVGDVVQDVGTPVLITGIETNAYSITVSGGNWYGQDGSGIENAPTTLKTIWAGQGSVQTGLNGGIVLREDNKQWVDGFYVTAPEQRIAARKVALNARRLRKK